MSPEVIAALVAAGAAVFAALLALWGQLRVLRLTASQEKEKRREDKRDEVERVMSRYREPLVRAAYDLQSRLYNIAAHDFLGAYWANGTKEERAYAINNTLFLISQFFCWNEILRHDVQFLDLGGQEPTRRLAELQDDITSLWGTDRHGRELRIFAGDQRAIGERMMRRGSSGLECLGYADFADTVRQQPARIPHLDLLRQDIEALAQSPDPRNPRLVRLQNALIDLLDHLDPGFQRFPKERRTKLPV